MQDVLVVIDKAIASSEFPGSLSAVVDYFFSSDLTSADPTLAGKVESAIVLAVEEAKLFSDGAFVDFATHGSYGQLKRRRREITQEQLNFEASMKMKGCRKVDFPVASASLHVCPCGVDPTVHLPTLDIFTSFQKSSACFSHAAVDAAPQDDDDNTDLAIYLGIGLGVPVFVVIVYFVGKRTNRDQEYQVVDTDEFLGFW